MYFFNLQFSFAYIGKMVKIKIKPKWELKITTQMNFKGIF